MKTEKLNSWLSLGANIGVVLGLILLIVEIGQNTEMMRAQINQSRTEAAMTEQQGTFNSDHIPALLLKREKDEPLTEEEAIRYRTYLRGFSRNMDNQLWQYQQGLLGENIPRSIRGAVRAVVGDDKLAIEIWDNQKYGFTDEYIALVEETIADLREVEPPISPYNNILKRSKLDTSNGDEIQMREILFAPGWTAPRHYHNSDLFIYVISGEFEVDMDGDGLKTYTNGQALRMKPNAQMYARNPSTKNSLKLAVFQIGNPDLPFVVAIEN